MNHNEAFFFGSFFLVIFSVLALDLGVFNRREHSISNREAFVWSVIWILFACLFGFVLYLIGDKLHGINNMEDLIAVTTRYKQKVVIIPGDYAQSIINYKKNLFGEYITGFLIEKSLSLDNLFVMLLIFSSFGIPSKYFHRILFWGILGAVISRFVFIFAGALLIRHFEWTLYLFGAFLIYSGIKMFFDKSRENIETNKHPIVKFASRNFRVHPTIDSKKFFLYKESKLYITPLFLVLLIIEATDIVFAVDSIPAIFSITKDPYIVFFSNIFAILGLRALFFLIANIMKEFRFFNKGLAVLLAFIGVKMLVDEYLHELGFGVMHTLIAINVIIGISIIASLLFPEKKKQKA